MELAAMRADGHGLTAAISRLEHWGSTTGQGNWPTAEVRQVQLGRDQRDSYCCQAAGFCTTLNGTGLEQSGMPAWREVGNF